MRTGKGQRGRFDVLEGMAFMMDDMEDIAPKGVDIDAGNHPWLVTMVDDDVVEVVMCTTLSNDKTGKHRMQKLHHDNVTDLPTGCPPMDPPSVRLNAVSLDTVMVLPKKELFTRRLRLLNENTEEHNFSTKGIESLCLPDNELNLVRNELNEYLSKPGNLCADPFGYEEAENNLWAMYRNEPIPKGFTEQSFKDKFDWQFLPKSDKRAMYPAESRMHTYEKNDVELLRLVKQRDAGSDFYKQRHFKNQQYRPKIDDFTEAVNSIPSDDKGQKR